MNAENGALIKTGVNEQMLRVNRRSHQALIEKEYRELAKDYAEYFAQLADSVLLERVTLAMDAEEVAAIDQLLVYKFGRIEAVNARCPCIFQWMAFGSFIVFFMTVGVGHYLATFLSFVGMSIAGYCVAKLRDDGRVSRWLNTRRKLKQLKGDDFSPYDALRQ